MRPQSLPGATCSSSSSSTAWHYQSQPRLTSQNPIQQRHRPPPRRDSLACAAAASTDAPASAAAAAAAATPHHAAAGQSAADQPVAVDHQHSRKVRRKASATPPPPPQQQQQQQQQPMSSKQQRQRDGRRQFQQLQWQSKLTPQELQQLFASQPKVLTAYIKASGSWQQLQQLLHAAGPAANHIHLAAAVVHYAQLQQQQQQQPEKNDSAAQQQHAGDSSSCSRMWMIAVICQLLDQHCSALQLRHISNILWALAVSSSSSSSSSSDNIDSSSSSSDRGEVPPSMLDSLLQVQLLQLQQHQQQQRTAVHTIKPQDLSNSIWALGKLQHQPSQQWLDAFWPLCMQLLPQFSLQELTNTAWGVARVAVDAQHKCMQAFLQAFLQESRSRLEQLQQQQQWSKDTTITAAAAALCQALANMAHALASLQCTPDPAWLGSFFSASEPLLQHFTGQQLSMTLWAVARWWSEGGDVAVPSSWVTAFAAAAGQQQQQQLSDQAIVNIAASSYQILLHVQHSLSNEPPPPAAAAAAEKRGVETMVHQLQYVLGLMLHAAAGRVQTLQVSAAAALAWASAGLTQQQQQQQQWLRQYVHLHTAAAAAAAGEIGSCSSSELQLLWLCAKADQLPSSEAWCAGVSAALQQQLLLQLMSAGQVAQLTWTVAKLLDCCCQQQHQCRHLHSLVPVGSEGTHQPQQQQQLELYIRTASITASLSELAVSLLHVVPSKLQDMHHKQFVETVVSSANVVNSLVCLQQQQQWQQQQWQQQQWQQQQQSPVPAAAAAVGLVQAIAMQAGSSSCSLTCAQQQLVVHAVHQLLLQCPHAAVCKTEIREALSTMMASVLQQQQQQHMQGSSGSSRHVDVCLAIRLLAVAQYPARAAAAAAAAACQGNAAAAAVRRTPQLQEAAAAGVGATPQLQELAAAAAAAVAVGATPQLQEAAPAAAVGATPQPETAATAAASHSGRSVLPWVLLPGSQHWQQLLLAQLGGMPDLNAQQLLSAAQLAARLRVVLPGSVLYRLLYTLQGHISANSYSPRQLLHVLLVLPYWRVVPRSAVAVRTSLINSWLMMTQCCMYDAIRLQLHMHQQQQQQQLSATAEHPEVPWPHVQSAATAAAMQLDGDLLSMMLTGLARLRVHPSEQWMQLFLRLLLPLLPQISSDQLSKVLVGLANLGYKPQEPVAQLLLQRSEQLLPSMTSSQLVRTMHALPKLQLQASDAWMQRFYAAVESRGDSLQISGFGMVVWALAKAGAQPDRNWMEQLLQRTFTATTTTSSSSSSSSVASSTRLKPQHLANILCAFAKLGFTPGPEWMTWFRVQLGQQAGALQELDHFHIEWAWKELNEQYRAAASRTAGDGTAGS